jgi:prepilin-type processing-associated H-X9-DG protein
MSRHPQGANFGFCDGSVHFLSENIDTTAYRNLGSMQDGQTVDTSSFMP